jgi:cyclic beta-1,2-glucan synthetase
MDALRFPLRIRTNSRRFPPAQVAEQPLRSGLLSIDLLRSHARTIAQNHKVAVHKGPNLLLPRLTANEKVLRDYNDQTLRVEKKRRITPAAEWLLDNFHLIEEQIRMARRHLPRGFSRELPHLTTGPSANLPRVYDVALELISNVDGRIDAPHLTSFVAAYQEVTHLKLGELWAIPIMLRLALIENLRRVAALASAARTERDAADAWVERILNAVETDPATLIIVVGEMAQAHPSLTRAFVSEFWRRAQEKSPALKLPISWIEDRLKEDHLTIEQLVQAESQNQAANQVSVGNSICSLRFLDAMDWREFVESQSVVEQVLRTDPADVYASMDFHTRDSYRHTVERVARQSDTGELGVAELAVKLARESANPKAGREAHVGFYLVGKGLDELERAAQMTLKATEVFSRTARRFPLAVYLGSIAALTFLATFPILHWAAVVRPSFWLLGILAALATLAASQLSVCLVNWFATVFVKPHQLPRLDFSEGIPADHRTLVAVPSMLASASGIDDLLEAIEVRYLANRDENVYFALLTDFRDAAQEHLPEDEELIRRAIRGITALNEKYKTDRPCVFYLFHRPRLWNERERVWMGYERKRGKLADLNRCLRGGSPECFSRIAGDLSLLPHIRYVITLDTDTQLPRDAARQLAATMAHPLNHPVYDAKRRLIVDGYSILQPRVVVSLPTARRSRFVKWFAGDPGLDPYTRAVSDVYQDVFHEGSFIGKGIYDVDAFERAVGGKFPENRILSHDLLEGSYARSGLVSDVELFEEFPARYSTDMQRRHRWIRGDWQIAAWLLPRLPGSDELPVQNPLTNLSRWKIFDNLRRSLVPVCLWSLLVIGWALFPGHGGVWSAFVLLIVGLPSGLAAVTDLVRKPQGLPLQLHLKNVGHGVTQQAIQALLTLTFLPYDACISLDAILRTLGRLTITRRNLLEWQTASDAELRGGSRLSDFYATMWPAPVLAALTAAGIALGGFHALPAALPFLLLWIVSPAVAWWISLPLTEELPQLSADQKLFLREVARKTWRFFETFTLAEHHWLPPDNFQENPRPHLAARTSPTNIGLALLASLSAYDFGYLSMRGLLEWVSRTLQTVEKLHRHQGHLYNWYDTRTLKPLPPLYVSTVDNGNLAGLLLTLESALRQIPHQNWVATRPFSGLRDALRAWIEEARRPRSRDDHRPKADAETLAKLRAIETQLLDPPKSLPVAYRRLKALIEAAADFPSATGGQSDGEFEWWRGAFEQSCRDHLEELEACFPWLKLHARITQLAAGGSATPELQRFWQEIHSCRSLQGIAAEAKAQIGRLDELATSMRVEEGQAATLELLAELRQELCVGAEEASVRRTQMEALASRCHELARMDFTLLYDQARELFSIGYNVSQHRLDSSCYDLLASEARLASYVAIAFGQVPQHHWFTLGRLLTTADGRPALISWSGSMFEYLMPMLVMPSYEGTLLDLSSKSAVQRQIEYGKQLHIPWGMSESGYNLRDKEANYQYRAFGVPGLGFKRGLAEEVVIAPYATVMASMVAPQEACRNLENLRHQGAEGKFGFYEAIDFTASRIPRGQKQAIVQSFMAHHQGMSLLALAYTLLDRPMQRRFNCNPLLKSAELLLHERVPKATLVLYPHELEASTTRKLGTASEASLRLFRDPNSRAPEVHLLSNSRYHVMITQAGGGYSHWNDIALTRWREDSTRDCWGTYLYLRDVETGCFWSAAYHPTLQEDLGYEAVFSQGRAEIRTHLNDIEAHTEITVSPEDDVEVRRLTLTNRSQTTKIIEVTSYAEVVLNTQAADLAHPAFSNLFVQTEILRSRSAIKCTRRPRSSSDQLPCMFHLLLAQGTEAAEASYETDRSKFIGRGRDVSCPAALQGPPALSNADGSVLDPVMAIRRTMRLSPNETARLTLVSGIASRMDRVSELIDKYQDPIMADRCYELAWTHGLIVLRHLNASEAEAQLYGRLAGALLYSQARRRANPAAIARNRRGQRNLWSFGISGDLPMVLVHSRTPERLDLIRELVQAHAYWRLKGLLVDLVILNEDDSVYRKSLHDEILTFVAAGNAAQLFDRPGGIFTRRVDQLSAEDLALLEAAARIVLSDENGTLAEQLNRRAPPERLPPTLPVHPRRTVDPPVELTRRDLLFFNGLGGFTRDGREYVITVQPGHVPPLPWVNVLANAQFGTLVSDSGGSYSWSENCHEFRLTPWHNDAVTDLSGEALYIRDEQSGRFWSPTPLPAGSQAPYVVRHGFGYSVFEHTTNGIASELWVFVSTESAVKFTLLKLRNVSFRSRALSITAYWEWVLGEQRQKNTMHIATEFDASHGSLLAQNPYNTDFEGRVAFVTSNHPVSSFTGDRTEFLGRNNPLSRPAAMGRTRLSGKVGVGLDPCAALQSQLTLEPGEEREMVFAMGAGQSTEQARALIQKFKGLESCREALQAVWALWNTTLGAVHVETPDPALNTLANGWLVYQTLSCRLWARTGFYQSGGAFGFRDQLQDSMALVHARPTLVREHLLRAAAHQFKEGDVQHWWHPPHDRGVRTHFSDDYLWLPYATARYVENIGDTGVLDENVPFLEGRAVRPEEEAYYDSPARSSESGPLYEHCVRAIRHGLRFGKHGLPLIGCGDWNDGMNLIGEHWKGESVWLAFFLCDVLRHFAPLARRRGDDVFAELCVTQAKKLQANIEQHGWDGQWYRRAYFDDGEPLGSATNPECQIDSLPQSWAVISGAGDPARARIALKSVDDRLVHEDSQMIHLFDPPFDKSSLEPGYIKGYVPGVRENGGQYTHAAIWTVMAFALAGESQRAWELFTLINPLLHANTATAVGRYKAEPYVVAADVYSVPPHTGRGGWTWYTGSAGWMYRLIVEVLLGLNVQGEKLHFRPHVPASWNSFSIQYRYRQTVYRILLVSSGGNWENAPAVFIDGKEQPGSFVAMVDDRKEHNVEVRFA